MNAVVKVNPQLPAAIAKHLATHGDSSLSEITSGVTSGFPVISYRGKVWRIRKGGEEHNILDAEEDPRPFIEVVLLASNPNPSKIFYKKKYEEGSNDTPTCWSADGIKPDAGVKQPVSKSCAACPNNVWGSRITEQGNKTKLCSDARRMAVTSLQELEELGEKAPLYLLRVPPASLNPLKDYADKVLKPKSLPYFAVVTKIGFDANSSYPKMTFKALRYLSEDEAIAVLKLRDSEDARRILAESGEYDAAGTTPTGDEASPSGEEGTGAPAAKSPKKSAKPRPAEEEDVGLEEEETPAPAPAPAKKKAAAPPPVADDDDEEEIPAPPPKKKAPPAPPVEDEEEEAAPPPQKPKKAPTPPPVEDEAEEEIAAPPPKKKAAAPPPVEDEEEEAPPPPPKKKKVAPAPPVEDEAEEETPAPPPKKKGAKAPAADSGAAGGDEFDSMLKTILG